MAVYGAMIDRLDQNIGRLIERLCELGEFDNTMILFTSDNGASDELVFAQDSVVEIGAEHPIGTIGRWSSLGGDWANVSNTPFPALQELQPRGRLGRAACHSLARANGGGGDGRTRQCARDRLGSDDARRSRRRRPWRRAADRDQPAAASRRIGDSRASGTHIHPLGQRPGQCVPTSGNWFRGQTLGRPPSTGNGDSTTCASTRPRPGMLRRKTRISYANLQPPTITGWPLSPIDSAGAQSTGDGLSCSV